MEKKFPEFIYCLIGADVAKYRTRNLSSEFAYYDIEARPLDGVAVFPNSQYVYFYEIDKEGSDWFSSELKAQGAAGDYLDLKKIEVTKRIDFLKNL